MINCKVELKLKWKKHCILSTDGNSNADVNSDIVFDIKTQNYMSLQSLYKQKTIKNYQNLLAKDSKDQFIGINTKQKVRIEIQQIQIFS